MCLLNTLTAKYWLGNGDELPHREQCLGLKVKERGSWGLALLLFVELSNSNALSSSCLLQYYDIQIAISYETQRSCRKEEAIEADF